jgi:hypothetical protein
VKITTYSEEFMKDTPDSAEFIVRSNYSDIFNLKTKFSIIKDISTTDFKENLRLEEAKANGNLGDKENIILNDPLFTIIVVRSSLILERISIISDINSTSNSYTFLGLSELQSKLCSLANMSIKICGSLLESVDPLNLQVHNITFDMEYVTSGFVLPHSMQLPRS